MEADIAKTPRERQRAWLLLHAYLHFHARKWPRSRREQVSWGLLLDWARLGGKPEEASGLR